jgi:hypothetical protein
MAFIDKNTNWLMYILPFFIGKIWLYSGASQSLVL